jgi:S-adenosylmethionine:tRNA ribosyltransferase-isomerase
VRTSDFEYELPGELIAQVPTTRRDESRLLVLRRGTGATEHRLFRDLVEYVRRPDTLVLNESRVIRARFLGTKRGTGGRVEMFLLKELGPGRWEALVRPGARIREGAVLDFGGRVSARVASVLRDGKRVVELSADGDLGRALDEVGRVPLPPYIDREPDAADLERYQTVYARVDGAVAAPTAGLHFTERLLASLAERGVGIARLTLHVGLGTFRPVAVEDPDEHEMEEERYDVSEELVGAVERTKATGGRVVAVGTTVARTLETVVDASGSLRAGSGATRLFIKPPHRFRSVDALVTNFHLPRSTLLMLVSAFGGRENVLAAYREAVRLGYRFYSYGDAMLIL